MRVAPFLRRVFEPIMRIGEVDGEPEAKRGGGWVFLVAFVIATVLTIPSPGLRRLGGVRGGDAHLVAALHARRRDHRRAIQPDRDRRRGRCDRRVLREAARSVPTAIRRPAPQHPSGCDRRSPQGRAGTIADDVPSASVLFTDVADFTPMSATISGSRGSRRSVTPTWSPRSYRCREDLRTHPGALRVRIPRLGTGQREGTDDDLPLARTPIIAIELGEP